MPSKIIDLRSDTVTKPTQEMREAMYKAEVGDDVYGEDPTVKKLEEFAAELSGKEAALFVTSGTMGNQISIMSHVNPGDELICERDAHIFYYEVGGIAALSHAQTNLVAGVQGIISVEDIAERLRPDDIHQPPTSLICLENTHNRAGGTYYSVQQLADIHTFATSHNIPVHIDGARVMNAVVATKSSLKEVASYASSISICLSKGLGAPIGAIVVGERNFINKARRMRKRLGGGMRQAGIIASAGHIALDKMVGRLEFDHAHARRLAVGLKEIGFDVDLSTVQTNIVFVNLENPKKVLEELNSCGVKANVMGNRMRMVTHYDVTQEDIDYVLHCFMKFI